MTWEPGVPLYPHPTDRAFGECDRPMIDILPDTHDERVELLGSCRICDDPTFVGYSGLAWSKFSKAGAR